MTVPEWLESEGASIDEQFWRLCWSLYDYCWQTKVQTELFLRGSCEVDLEMPAEAVYKLVRDEFRMGQAAPAQEVIVQHLVARNHPSTKARVRITPTVVEYMSFELPGMAA
jgi:hypothetical protein